MKKFLVIAAVAISVFASCKKVDPIPTGITLKTDSFVDLKESNFATIEFKASDAWKAELVFEEGVDAFASADVLAGTAGEECKIKLTIQSLPAELTGRAFSINIAIADETAPSATVIFVQGKIFVIECTSESSEVGVAGGTVDYAILTNCQYTAKKYDQFEEWAPCTIDATKNTLSFAVSANKGYDSRQAYVKFTVDEIQVPVLDDQGQPTGETEAAVYRAYVNQVGNITTAWSADIPAALDHGATSHITVAMFEGDLCVCDGTVITKFDVATGASKGTLNSSLYGGITPSSITSDDAGNLIVASTNVAYNELAQVYGITSSSQTGSIILKFYVDAWNGGHPENVRVKGNITGEAVVSMFFGGLPSYQGVSYGLKWQFTDGTTTWAPYGGGDMTTQPDYWVMTNVTADMWDVTASVLAPAGSKVEDGLFYIGYDGVYNLQYWNGTAWSTLVETGSSWAEGYGSLSTTKWNSHDYLAFVGMAFFPYWGMPSYLWIVDLTDAKVVSCSECYGANSQVEGGMAASADVTIKVENGSLAAYVVDGAQNTMFKKVFPVLK